MNEISKIIIDKYQVRKTKQQKTEFIEFLKDELKDIELKTYAYPDKFIQHGTVEELEKLYNQDVEYIVKEFKESL